jgi:hypothetical protein
MAEHRLVYIRFTMYVLNARFCTRANPKSLTNRKSYVVHRKFKLTDNL